MEEHEMSEFQYISELEPYASVGDEIHRLSLNKTFIVLGEDGLGGTLLKRIDQDGYGYMHLIFDTELLKIEFQQGDIINYTRRTRERIELWKRMKT
jgi:hypothetical protein